MLFKLLFLAALPVVFLYGQFSLPLYIYTLTQWLPSSIQTLIPTPQVTISQGTLIGTTERSNLRSPVDAFKGIPYALPPVGDRRFRPAVAVAASDDIIDARQFGARCPGKQLLQANGDNVLTEDCLTVNVFRPRGVTGKLPVAVYVHGGAYNRGTSSMHNTASMVGWSEEPFVAVSFNYRIGALGFLPSTLTAEEDVLNLGLRDQILLLQWVQENIEAFGGDPSQVTLFGLSAGAHSIAHHIMNPDLPPLFHRAIIESGSATSRAVHPFNAKLHEDQFQEYITEAGCAHVPKESIMACLRSQPSPTVINASFTVFARYNPSVRWAFQPVIDNDLIKQRPIDAWKGGKWTKMPIITGFNTNEGTYYVPKNMKESHEFTDFFKTLLPAYSDRDIKTIDKLYPDLASSESPYVETRNIPVGPQYKRVEAAYGHYAYACPVRQTAALASDQTPVYLYHWALNKTVQGGANHGDQMAYETFNPEVWSISPSQEEMAGTLHAYFTSFIVSGDPNKIPGRYPDRAVWGDYTGKKIMVFGEGNDERAGGDGKGVIAQMKEDIWSKKECDFWWTKSGISD